MAFEHLDKPVKIYLAVVVGYGVTVPKGSLPVFSVDTERDAERLIVAACPLSDNGYYYAEELADEQTLENLAAFSDRLAAMWGRIN